MGTKSANEIGRNATRAWWSRRTGRFHLAFTIHVTAATAAPPTESEVK